MGGDVTLGELGISTSVRPRRGRHLIVQSPEDQMWDNICISTDKQNAEYNGVQRGRREAIAEFLSILGLLGNGKRAQRKRQTMVKNLGPVQGPKLQKLFDEIDKPVIKLETNKSLFSGLIR